MIYLLGGIPHPIFDLLIGKKASFLREKALVVALPLRRGSDGFCVNVDHAEKLKVDLVSRIASGNARSDEPVCVLYLGHDFFQRRNSEFEREFFPHVLVKRVALPFPVEVKGVESKKYVNNIVPELRRAAARVAAAADAMATELRARRQRTPLHLPMTNFISDSLRANLEHLFGTLGNGDSDNELIRQACGSIEREHPFIQANGRRFVDSGGLAFQMPGRELHGVHWPGAPHTINCDLNSRYRLSGPMEPGFHFDCSAGKKQVDREFRDCHGVLDARRGENYVNIFPNDYIR